MVRSLKPEDADAVRHVAAAESATPLHLAVARVFYQYIHWVERRLAETDLDKHLSPGMGPVIFALFEQDDVIIKDLVERTRLMPSTVGRTLTRMEKSGLVDRRRDPADGRAVRIRLTVLGRSLEADCRKLASEVTALMQDGIAADQIAAMSAGLDRMLENLRNGAD